MTRRSVLPIALLAAACVLGGCKPATPVKALPAAAKPATSLDAAFAAAWGQAAPVVHVVERDGDKITLRYAPQQLIPLGDRLVLISGGTTDGCHGCQGSLAIHYLERTPAGLKPVGAWPEIAEGSSFGGPPAWKLREDLFPGQALELTSGGDWHGCAVSYADYVELTRDGPLVRARHILTAYDDADADGHTKLSAEAVPGVRGQDFTARYTGSEPVSVQYRRRGEAYLPFGPKPDLPEC